MKIVAKPVDMVVWCSRDGVLHPVKFRVDDNREFLYVVKVDKIINRHLEKTAGNDMMVFTCQSVINNIERLYQIKYELKSCKWILYKI